MAGTLSWVLNSPRVVGMLRELGIFNPRAWDVRALLRAVLALVRAVVPRSSVEPHEVEGRETGTELRSVFI